MIPRSYTVQKDAGAFTLVEVLVGIAIVAILAVFLMSTIDRTRARAEGVECLSNLRQIGTAFILYHGENNGRLPGAYYETPAQTPPLRQWWRENSVGAYLGENHTSVTVQKYYNCPTKRPPNVIFDYCYNSNFEFMRVSTLSPNKVIVTENHGQLSGIVYNTSFWWHAVGYWHPAPKPPSANDLTGMMSARASALHLDGRVEHLDSATLLERSKP